jgi:hypothetical protein
MLSTLAPMKRQSLSLDRLSVSCFLYFVAKFPVDIPRKTVFVKVFFEAMPTLLVLLQLRLKIDHLPRHLLELHCHWLASFPYLAEEITACQNICISCIFEMLVLTLYFFENVALSKNML